ncbi:MAG TPA: TetR family transcriptional regulator [Acidimicrobiia bacterium]|nr:TetR family transcriptional regulator [Acidimicrobiia bacterium]
MTATPTTKEGVLAAAKQSLIESGYAQLSTRRIAEMAGVPLSQIHYHFGSKQNLVLEVLAEENRRLLDRQAEMYSSDQPMWKRWEQACDFLDDDLESGYVRVLQEMMAAGWSDPEIADAVRGYLYGWFALLRSVATSAMEGAGNVAILEPDHVAALVGSAFIGAEALLLLGFENDLNRAALRSVGDMIRRMEQEDAG